MRCILNPKIIIYVHVRAIVHKNQKQDIAYLVDLMSHVSRCISVCVRRRNSASYGLSTIPHFCLARVCSVQVNLINISLGFTVVKQMFGDALSGVGVW